MALFLKQSTSVDVPIGPFVDATDGVTAETALTITQPDIRLKKNGGAWAQKNAAQTLSHEENGWYEVTLDATDTNTLGLLKLAVHESGALPVFHDFMVLPANVYDSLVSGSDNLQVDTIQVSGTTQTAGDIPARLPAALVGGRMSSDLGSISSDATAADNLEAALDGTGGVTITAALTGNITGNLSGSVGSVTGNVGGNVGGNVAGSVASVAAGGIAAASIADGAFTAAKFASGAFDAVWSVATRTLTAGTNIVLAKGTGITGFNDLSAAQVNAEADTALADVGLTTTITGRIDAAISTRLATAGYTAPPTATQNADALLNRDMSAVSDTNARTPLNALRVLRNRVISAGGTLTVKKEDDSTNAWTAALTGTAGADPITEVDPT
jgi:hypothetical protein